MKKLTIAVVLAAVVTLAAATTGLGGPTGSPSVTNLTVTAHGGGPPARVPSGIPAPARGALRT